MFRRPKKPNELAIDFDLNSGLIDAVRNPPEGFISKFDFANKGDLKARVESIRWFENCGKPFAPDLTMPHHRIVSWEQANALCKSPDGRIPRSPPKIS